MTLSAYFMLDEDMDIELARTFLEIVSSGSFVRAAERLNVGQTTVSARIVLWSNSLDGVVRSQQGWSIADAGWRAVSALRADVRAVVAACASSGSGTARPSRGADRWQRGEPMAPLLLDWILWMRARFADIALRVHVDVPQDLINQVAAGLVDVAIMYAPQHRPGLKIDLLMEEKLVLVTTNPKSVSRRTDYVYVDWGPDFMLHHGMSFPEATPGLFVNLGPLALSYVLAVGGSGYFRMSAVSVYSIRAAPPRPMHSILISSLCSAVCQCGYDRVRSGLGWIVT